MAKQTINIGSAANDGTGSTLREAFDITNDNFTELYGGTGGLFHKIEGTNFTGSLLVGHNTTGTLSSALNNTGIGIGALDALTSGDSNVAIGRTAGGALTSGGHNIAIGHDALRTEDGHGTNIAIGTNALYALDAGADAYNVAIGYNAGKLISTGVRNTLIGAEAGDALTTGQFNVALGYAALSTEDDSGFNTAVGYGALRSQNASGNGNNVAVGKDAGVNVSTGINNTIIGALAGDALQTGSNNILIGKNAAASAVDVSNEITFGDTNITNVRIPSDSTLKIGAGGDLQLEHLSGHSFIKNTDTGDLYIENQVDDGDVIFRCDNGSGGLATYLTLDGGTTSIVVSASLGMYFNDGIAARFGTGGDLITYHDGSNSYITNAVGNLTITNGADDADIIFSNDDGSGGTTEYFRVDGGSTLIAFSKPTFYGDGVKALFGNSSDLNIYHNGTNSLIENSTGDFYISNKHDDGDIIFFCDDGSGGTTEYFRLDGDLGYSVASKHILLNDNVKLRVGSSADLEIYHDSNNSYIADTGTGSLKILATDFDLANSAANASMIRAIDGAQVELYYGGSKKFETTSGGVLLTSDGSAAAGAYLELKHANNNSTDVCATINLTNGVGSYAAIVGGTTGANNTGYIEFKTDNAGTQGTALTLNGDNSATFAGAITTTGNITANTGHVNIDSGYSFQWGDTHERIEQSDAKIEFFTNNTQQMTLSGNNLGIGTDSPGALLHLANTSGGPIYIEDTDATDTFDITSISNAAGTLSFDTRRTSDNGFVSTDYQIVKDASGANYHRWLTANAERMRINASGYIYVNTGGAEPGASQVGVRITGTQGQAFWNSANSGTTGYNHFNFYNANGAVGSIVTNGSATAFNTSSDYRLKEDLKDFDGLDKVSKIPVYDFKWKVDDSRSYGVMAHELQEVLPDAVSGEKDAEEMQGVDYSKIVPLLIKSIQELEARVKTLENK